MTSDLVPAIEELLRRTEAAHGAYEATQLNGIYDQDWPRWYAEYVVGHGIGDLLGRAVTADELARFLVRKWEELQEGNARQAEPWSVYTARQIVAEL